MSIVNDWKTTVTVIIGAIAYVLNIALEIAIPQESIIVVIVFILGLVSADTKSTSKETLPKE